MRMNALKMPKVLCVTLALGLAAACGGGGGGSQQAADPSQYVGITTRASLSSSNATAFTTDAFSAGSIGSSANLVGLMVQTDTSGNTVTLPEVATLVKGAVTSALSHNGTTAPTLAGVAAATTIYGPVGGSAAVSMDVNQTTGNFSGRMTFSNYQSVSSGPVISGTVTMTGIFSETDNTYSSITMVCAPLSATTTKGTSTVYGKFEFNTSGTSETLKMLCTLRANSGSTYWLKDWTYTFSGNTLTITGVYYHPAYGYAEMTTPTPLTVTSLSGTPSAGVFQAAGAHCSKARLTFTSTGSVVTAIGGDNQDWQVCKE